MRFTQVWNLSEHPKSVHKTRLGKLVAAGHELKCVCCPRRGVVVKQWVDGGGGIHHDVFCKDGVMFTQDHILPVSRGGSNHLKNLRVMCSKHNAKRSNHCTLAELQYILANIQDLSTETKVHRFVEYLFNR